MDEKVTISQQMEENVKGTVILIAKFNVKPEEVDDFLRAWADEAVYLKSQPGLVVDDAIKFVAGYSNCNKKNWEHTKSSDDGKKDKVVDDGLQTEQETQEAAPTTNQIF